MMKNIVPSLVVLVGSFLAFYYGPKWANEQPAPSGDQTQEETPQSNEE